MKLIIYPLPLVSCAAIGIGELAEATHFIVPPLPHVSTPLTIVEFPSPVSLPIPLVALITSAYLIFLNYKLRIAAGLFGRILLYHYLRYDRGICYDL